MKTNKGNILSAQNTNPANSMAIPQNTKHRCAPHPPEALRGLKQNLVRTRTQMPHRD